MRYEHAWETILREFLEIAQIPRPSHHEEKIAAYLLQWAKDHGLSAVQDELGDVIMEKEASAGYENAPRVILQAHMDMVCVAADGMDFDPLNDPIRVVNDGKTLRAVGTSLGADDGIGVAICLYILEEKSLHHGPIRAIFTVDEEDGMDSCDMNPKYLDGAYLINLDWESLGSLCNSSAGCDFLTFTRSADWEPSNIGQEALKIQLKGLLGGHSGVDINKGRANALVSLAAGLHALTETPFQLADFHGGQAKNAIPAFAEATITVPKGQAEQVRLAFQKVEKNFRSGFGDIETGYSWAVESVPLPDKVLGAKAAKNLLDLLMILPNNVHTMSPFVPSLTESSQNLGVLALEGETIVLSGLERSCAAYRREEILRANRLAAAALDFQFIQGDHAPAWALNPKSRLTSITCETYKKITGNDMVVEPVHGGLECGAFSEKNPALDMIAIGPTLQNVHSAKESCDLESVRITAELVAAVLEKLR
jgi:dipeptidase D